MDKRIQLLVRHIVYLLFISLHFPLLSQTSKIDSLKAVLIDTPFDTSTVQVVDILAGEYLGVNYDSAIHYGHKTMEYARKYSVPIDQTSAWYNLGKAYLQKEKLDSAAKYAHLYLASQRKSGDKNGERKALTILGEIEGALGNYSQELLHFTEALAIASELQDTLALSLLSYNIALVHYYNEDNDLAVSKALESLDFSKSINDIKGALYATKLLGILYRNNHQYDQAEDIFRETLLTAEKANDPTMLGEINNSMGVLLINIHNDSAIFFLEKAAEIWRGTGNVYQYLISELNIGAYYRRVKGDNQKAISQYQKVLNQIGHNHEGNESIRTQTYLNLTKAYTLENDCGSAIAYGSKAFDLVKNDGYTRQLWDASDYLYQAFQRCKVYDSALFYHEKLMAVKDTIFSEEKTRAIEDMLEKYESEKKEEAIKLLNAEKEAQELRIISRNYLITGTILGLILLIALAVLINRQSTARQKRNLVLSDKNFQIEQQKEQIETLLMEKRHRTSNDWLRIEGSIFDGKHQGYSDQEILENVTRQISTIKDIHELLDTRDNKVSVLELFDLLLAVVDKKVVIDKEIITVQLAPYILTKLGLILNELLTNANKYAFVNHPNPNLIVKFYQQEHYFHLHVEDNGEGAANQESTRSTGQGMKLIALFLQEDLNGNFKIDTENGYLFHGKFPKPKA